MRPDVVTFTSLASKVSASTFSKTHINLLKDAVRRAHASPDRGLIIYPLEEKFLCIILFTDVSFSHKGDFSAQIGYAVFLVDEGLCTNCLHCTS